MGMLGSAILGTLPAVDSWAIRLELILPARDEVELAGKVRDQNEWITSEDSSLISTGTPTGMWISFAVVKRRAGVSSSYSICHHHWRPVTFRVTAPSLVENTAF